MALGKPEHPGHVPSAGYGATMFNYFHTSSQHRQGITNEDVARLMEVKLQEEKKFKKKNRRREEENGRQEDDFRASFMSEIEKNMAGFPNEY